MTASPDQSTDNKWTKRLSRKGWIILISALALLALLIIWLVFLRSPSPDDNKNTSSETTSAKPQPALTVTVVSPQLLNWEQTFTANGNVAAWQEVVIGSELSGQRLLRVNVNVGDVVKRGQMLAEINSDTIRADLASAKASLAEAQAVLADATANNRRIQQLKNTGAISVQEAAQYQTTQSTAQARLDAARAQIDSNQLRLAQSHVVAPDNGVISARTATVGSLAQTGQELFRMIRNNRLEWRAEVTTTDLYKLKEGMIAKIYSPDPTLPAITGKVRMIAPVIDPQTRYGLVYVDLPANNAVRMGMFVKGAFDLGAKQALTVPQSALLLRDGFSYVFIVNSQNRVVQQKVTLGRRLGDRVEVTNLPANVNIVSTGTGFLSDGDLVTVAAAIPDTPLSKQLITDSATLQGN